MASHPAVVLCADPKAQYLHYRDEIDATVRATLEKGHYILGDEVRSFEKEFAAYVGVDFAIGVANGTDAITLALMALGIGAGDEVITVSHTATATIAAIERAGATPVIVDIDPVFFGMDASKLTAALSKRTRAIVAVHLYGCPLDLESITRFAEARGLALVEDCAQSHGAVYQGRKVGSWGVISCFSFYPTKNLGAVGDGGMVVTSDHELAERCRMLREYGWKTRFQSDLPGMNSRLDELQAAILRVKLPHLDRDNASRARIAKQYIAALGDGPWTLPTIRDAAVHVFHLFVLRTTARDELKEFLAKRGVVAGVHYPVPVHRQPAYRERVRLAGSLSQTEKAANEVLSLPMFPELSKTQMDRVIEVMQEWKHSSIKAARRANA